MSNVCCGVWPNSCDTQRKRRGVCAVTSVVLLTVFILVCVIIGESADARWFQVPALDFPKQGELQYGIRWFTEGTVRLPGIDMPPPKLGAPTFIYVHGWQNGACAKTIYENLKYSDIDAKYGDDTDLADLWREKGWNVGVFYYTPLADEAKVQDASAKVWSTKGANGMRWRTRDGSYSSKGSPDMPVADLFVQSYLRAFNATDASQYPSQIRLAGHSLGTQVVSRAVNLLAKQVRAGTVAKALMPARVALLDPYVGSGDETFAWLDGKRTGEAMVEAWTDTLSNTGNPSPVLAFYQSSIVPDSDTESRDALYRKGVPVRVGADFFDTLDLQAAVSDHMYAIPFYLQSFRRSQGVGAGATDEDMRKLMGTGVWEQTAGRKTIDPSDDSFELTPWSEVDLESSNPLAVIFWFIFLCITTSVLGCCCMCCCVRHRCMCFIGGKSSFEVI